MTTPARDLHSSATPQGSRTSSRFLLGWLMGGFVVWFVLLCAMYGLHAVGCDSGWGDTRIVVRLALLLVGGATIIAGLWLVQPWRRAQWDFARRVVGWSLLAAAAASVAVMAPPLWLTPCG